MTEEPFTRLALSRLKINWVYVRCSKIINSKLKNIFTQGNNHLKCFYMQIEYFFKATYLYTSTPLTPKNR